MLPTNQQTRKLCKYACCIIRQLVKGESICDSARTGVHCGPHNVGAASTNWTDRRHSLHVIAHRSNTQHNKHEPALHIIVRVKPNHRVRVFTCQVFHIINWKYASSSMVSDTHA